MRRITILALVVLPVVFLLFTGVAMAGVAPHGGYGTGTDYCLSCHDVHDALGDYALTREATVTQTCATCHGLFGQTPDGTWTITPPDLVDGANATASQYSAYKNIGAAKASGHDLGVSLNGEPSRTDAAIPGGTLSLRVMRSADYEDGELYNHENATDFSGTSGLYCASCHTPHSTLTGIDTDGNGIPNTPNTLANGNYGRQLVVDESAISSHPKNVSPAKLLSSRPNHTETNVTSYAGFCISCHDQRVDSAAHQNHPPLCVSCHKKGAKGAADFPHTSGNQYLMGTDSDKNCTGCHGHAITELDGTVVNPLP
ncbi:MAG: cytochrome c3 family protein [Thermoleophilia bacterium]|jgi:predicted CXXCH cytochrome family protein